MPPKRAASAKSKASKEQAETAAATVEEKKSVRKAVKQKPADKDQAEPEPSNAKKRAVKKPESTEEPKRSKRVAKSSSVDVNPVKPEEVKEKTKKKSKKSEHIDEHEPPKKKSAVAKKVPAKKDTKSRNIEKSNEEPEKKTLANKKETSWEEIKFSSEAKNVDGKTYNYLITSWNVGGIRAWIKKGGLDILKYSNADVLCVQETKCSVEKLPDEIKDIEGYNCYWASSKKEGYAGVGILSKSIPDDIMYGIDVEDHDDEGRCITAEFKHFYLMNVYVPNSGRKLVTLDKRLDWNDHFKIFVKKLSEKKPVILCGDMNVAHKEIDLSNPKTNTKNAGFTPEEREGMTEFLAEGYIDSFRELYPDQEGAYTFWSFMNNARNRNIGWRLDYFIVPKDFMNRVCDSVIHNDVFGSDHCPLSLFVNV